MHWHRYTNEHSKTQGNAVPDRYTAAKALQNSVKLHLTVWRVQLYPVLWKPSTTCGHYLYNDHHNYDEQERLTSVLPFSFLIQLLLEFCATAQLNALGPVYKQQLKIHTLLSAVNITSFYREKLKCPCDKKKSLPFFLQILKAYLLDTWQLKFQALIFIQRLLSLNVNFGFYGPPLLAFKTNQLDLWGLNPWKSDIKSSLTYILSMWMQLTHAKPEFKSLKAQTRVQHINSVAYTGIVFSN